MCEILSPHSKLSATTIFTLDGAYIEATQIKNDLDVIIKRGVAFKNGISQEEGELFYECDKVLSTIMGTLKRCIKDQVLPPMILNTDDNMKIRLFIIHLKRFNENNKKLRRQSSYSNLWNNTSHLLMLLSDRRGFNLERYLRHG